MNGARSGGGSDGGGKLPPRTARIGRAPATSGRERENASPRHRSALSGRSPAITVMINAAMKAARTLRRDFGEIENLQISEKGPSDFVSQADMRAEEFLREELMKVRPGYGFIGEEGKPIEGDGKNRFIVDPLDGTTNFLHGIPHFAISIALEREGEIVAGVVYEPVGDELFWAEKGAGAFLDTAFAKSRRLRVSARRRMGDCLIGTGIPFRGRGDHPSFLKEMSAVMADTAGIRRMGAASLDLAFVAAGRLDGYWETGLKSWDVAAGALLVREAGGMVSEIGGRAHKLDSATILAANGNIGPALDRLLKGVVRD